LGSRDHDGYRSIVATVAPCEQFTAAAIDWADCYPAIAGAATTLRARSFTLDGEVVVCGLDGIAVFDALHG
jgi:ATP-dependent DNA ligase